MDWTTMIAKPAQQTLMVIAGFVPKLLGALLIFFVGCVVANAIKKIAARMLGVIKFEAISEKSGFSKVLSAGEVKLTATEVVSTLTYWLTMFIVLVITVNALGLTMASELLDNVVTYIPNVIAALFVSIVGLFLGNFVSSVVKTAASNSSVPNADIFAGVAKWIIVIFSLTIALGQLGIAPALLSSVFIIFWGSLCLGLALAFGLGGKDLAAKYLDDAKKKYCSKA